MGAGINLFQYDIIPAHWESILLPDEALPVECESVTLLSLVL
jgi:hypothetical protein